MFLKTRLVTSIAILTAVTLGVAACGSCPHAVVSRPLSRWVSGFRAYLAAGGKQPDPLTASRQLVNCARRPARFENHR